MEINIYISYGEHIGPLISKVLKTNKIKHSYDPSTSSIDYACGDHLRQPVQIITIPDLDVNELPSELEEIPGWDNVGILAFD